MKLKTQGILRSLTIPRHGEVLVGGGDKGCTVWSIVACANKKRYIVQTKIRQFLQRCRHERIYMFFLFF